jgi:soluble lytic murein transglycosylase
VYPIRYAFTMMNEQCDMSLCLAMIWQESLFQPQAVSSANAKGLMQIIPATAKQIARELGVSSYAVHDASTSIKFGWYYFSNMLKEFNSIPLSLAGYNAGPHRVKRWITNNSDSEIDEFIELIPYNETRNYVKSVLARQVIYKTLLERNRLMTDSTEGSSTKNN